MRDLRKWAPLALLLAMNASVQARPTEIWAGFYDRETLLYWRGQTPPGVEENFREVIWPSLTPEEKRSIGNVALDFPLEDASHPMNFYASSSGAGKTITLPVSSLRFFGDIALAYVWLGEFGYSLQPITDYLAMLKYRWPSGELAGRRYRPREVLGIPQDATANPRVANKFQQIYGTAIVFLLGHELGHLYYKHIPLPTNRAPTPQELERSRLQEEQADQFGLEIMRRIGAAPVGMVPYFMIVAHLEAYKSDHKSDADYLEAVRTATHPVTSSRLRAIASGLKALEADFTRTGTRPATLQKIAANIDELTKLFDDAGVQDLLRRIGRAAEPGSLGPRKTGAGFAAAARTEARGAQSFSGKYRGEWRDAKGVALDVTMDLTRQGDRVMGTYRFGDPPHDATSLVKIEGFVSDNELAYAWKWGKDHFGKGLLKQEASGHGLIGTWGYTEADTGGGTWTLQPAE